MKNKIITVLDSLRYYNYPACSASVSCQSTLFEPKTFSYCLVVICIIMRFWCFVFRFINLFFTVIIVAFPYVFNLWCNMHNRRNHWNGEILACFPAYYNQFKEVILSFNITQAVQQNQHGSFHVPLPLSIMHLLQVQSRRVERFTWKQS